MNHKMHYNILLQQVCLPPQRDLTADFIHDDLSIRLAREMVVATFQQLFAELAIVGQLAVEGEAKPLRLLQVLPFKRLSKIAVILAARCVANVTDSSSTSVFRHQALSLTRTSPESESCVPGWLSTVALSVTF